MVLLILRRRIYALLSEDVNISPLNLFMIFQEGQNYSISLFRSARISIRNFIADFVHFHNARRMAIRVAPAFLDARDIEGAILIYRHFRHEAHFLII